MGRPSIEGLDPASVLAELAAQSAQIETIEAKGKVTLRLPESPAARRFYGPVRYARPDKLFLEGYHRASGKLVAKLTAAGDDFAVEFPSEPGESVYQWDGRRSQGEPLPVSPSAIVGEMFFPEEWRNVAPGDFRIVRVDRSAGLFEAEVWRNGQLRRRLAVQAAPLAVVRSELYRHGEMLAVTTFENYIVVGETVFPTKLHAEFPAEQSVLDLEITAPAFNVPLDASVFDVRAHIESAGLMNP